MAQGTCEELWIKGILEDLKIQYKSPTKLFCHNKSFININYNPIRYDQTKHVKVDHHVSRKK